MLKKYEELATPLLELPIGGKVYTVPPVGAREGIQLVTLMALTQTLAEGRPADAVAVDDDTETDLCRLALGAAYDEMVADNVPIEALGHAGLTALADFAHGRVAAELYWNTGGAPERLAPPRGLKPSTGLRTSTSGAGARKTRKPGSGTGTTSRKTSKTSSPAPASS